MKLRTISKQFKICQGESMVSPLKDSLLRSRVDCLEATQILAPAKLSKMTVTVS